MTTRGMRLLITRAAVALAAVASVGVTAALVSTGPLGAATDPAAAAPAVSPTNLYVDPDSPAAHQVRQWEAEGRTADARRVAVIADQPVPQWLTAPTGQVGGQVAGFTDRAAAAGKQPLLVAYHIPGRDCGSFSGGGARDAADYRAWIREVAAALRGRAATVVLEPDAVPHALAGCDGSGRADERYALLADAVDVLRAAGPVTVYVDAGNPGFITDVGALAEALRRSGVARASGFSLNVANFWPTADNVAFGRRLSDALAGARFVVDTSRNGSGRVGEETVDGGPAWCNPPGRAVGTAPTRDTGDPRVDAFLWIKRPGESDGACRPGEPRAGQWWPEYALNLVRPR